MKQSQRICELAYSEGWKRLWKRNGFIRFIRGMEVCDICPTTLTVYTMIDHPKYGYTMLVRKRAGIRNIRKILHDPRTHTGRGKHLEVMKMSMATLNFVGRTIDEILKDLELERENAAKSKSSLEQQLEIKKTTASSDVIMRVETKLRKAKYKLGLIDKLAELIKAGQNAPIPTPDIEQIPTDDEFIRGVK